MKNAIVKAVTVSAVLVFGYYLVEGIQVANKARNFGGGLRQELEAIGTKNAPVQTKVEQDAPVITQEMDPIGTENVPVANQEMEATVTEDAQGVTQELAAISAENAQVKTEAEMAVQIANQELSAISTENTQVKTQAQMDAHFCAILEEADTVDEYGVCHK